MATHCSILAGETPWTEEPGRLQSLGLQKSQIQLDNNNLFSTFTGIEMDKYVVLRWIIHRVSLSDLDNADN